MPAAVPVKHAIIRAGTESTAQGEIGCMYTVLGLNHETAPVALREQVVLAGPVLEQFYRAIAALPQFEGVVVVSTCNRTEVYWAGGVSMSDVLDRWAAAVDVPRDKFSDHLYLYTGAEAARHLFRVAAGLDAMMIGETQVLGQVKQAYQWSHQLGYAHGLHRLFLAALKVGKRAHAETTISESALSIGYAGVELARKVYGDDLSQVSVAVVGTGEMGSLVARHLATAGIGRMLVLNRTRARAEGLAQELRATVEEVSRVGDLLAEVDLVVTSTSSPVPVITRSMVKNHLRQRRGRAILFLDLAVPRDVEPGVETLTETVFRYDVDDLKAVVAHNRERREREAVSVERIIEEERQQLARDGDVTEVVPLIRSLRQKAESIRRQELDETFRKLSHLTEHDRQVVERATRLMLNKLLNDPMVSIRGWASQPDGALYLDTLRDLFRLDEEGSSRHPTPVPEGPLTPSSDD